jgi:hypothetical protein
MKTFAATVCLSLYALASVASGQKIIMIETKTSVFNRSAGKITASTICIQEFCELFLEVPNFLL